jgi:hypothetical protein
VPAIRGMKKTNHFVATNEDIFPRANCCNEVQNSLTL